MLQLIVVGLVIAYPELVIGSVEVTSDVDGQKILDQMRFDSLPPPR